MPAPTFNVTLEELGQDAVGSQLVKHAAEELLGYACYIPWDQHAADKKIFKKHSRRGEWSSHTHTSIIKLIYKHKEYVCVPP